MDGKARDNRPTERSCKVAFGFFHFAGCRYWTASLFPALLGTTLPFWLRPSGFSFRWLGAIEFLIATLLFHAGFSFLQAWFDDRSTADWARSRLLWAAGVCILAGCVLGLHLNNGLSLHRGVPRSIFIVYGLSTLFAGVLYVVPPLNFRRRVGGEVVLSVSLGLVPVLGAYLVQVGDITRKVYVAALPLVFATGLWVWASELVSREADERAGRKTMVMFFGPRMSARFAVPGLSILLYATLFLAVFSASIMPLALIALLAVGFAGKVITVSWNDYESEARMLQVHQNAFKVHLGTSIIMVASSLAAPFR